MFLRPHQGTTSQAPSAWNATLGRMTSCPAPAFWAATPHRPSAAALRVPAGETPVTSAQLRTQVRPLRVLNPQCQLCKVTLKQGERRRGQSLSVSKPGCLLAQRNSARSALVVKATSPWTEPGCLDRPRTQVTSLKALLPRLHSPQLAQPGPPGGPQGSSAQSPSLPGPFSGSCPGADCLQTCSYKF